MVTIDLDYVTTQLLAAYVKARRDAGDPPKDEFYDSLPLSLRHAWQSVAKRSAELTVEALHRPIAMRLNCPECGELHIDEGEFATKPHHTHACQSCGMVWRPALVATVGVQFLPGFKNP